MRPRPLLGYVQVPPHPQQRQAWQGRLAKVRYTGPTAACTYPPWLKGLATAAYGVSQITYHLEFADAPDDLRQAMASVNTTVRGCDIGLVDPRLLTGSPVAWEFGAMPLEEHVIARHLAHASALLTYLLQDVVQQEGGAHDSATPPAPAAAVHRPL